MYPIEWAHVSMWQMFHCYQEKVFICVRNFFLCLRANIQVLYISWIFFSPMMVTALRVHREKRHIWLSKFEHVHIKITPKYDAHWILLRLWISFCIVFPTPYVRQRGRSHSVQACVHLVTFLINQTRVFLQIKTKWIHQTETELKIQCA